MGNHPLDDKYTLDEAIDLILKGMDKDPLYLPTIQDVFNYDEFAFKYDNRTMIGKAMDYLRDERIVIDATPDRYKMASKGIKISKKGGWIKYLENKERKKNMIERQIQSTINTNELMQNNLKSQKDLTVIAIWVAAIAAASTLLQAILSLLQVLKNK
jgi:hypothetical protein